MLITDSQKKDIATLAQKYGLSLVVLFGSQVTGAVHSKSDVDIAVLGTKKNDRIKLMNDFDEVFKRDDIEVVNMNEASPTMMRVLVEEGKSLYERMPDTFFNWKLYAIKMWMETDWLRKLGERKAVEWARQIT